MTEYARIAARLARASPLPASRTPTSATTWIDRAAAARLAELDPSDRDARQAADHFAEAEAATGWANVIESLAATAARASSHR